MKRPTSAKTESGIVVAPDPNKRARMSAWLPEVTKRQIDAHVALLGIDLQDFLIEAALRHMETTRPIANQVANLRAS